MTNPAVVKLLKIISKYEKEEKHIIFFLKYLDQQELETDINVENGIIDALSNLG